MDRQPRADEGSTGGAPTSWQSSTPQGFLMGLEVGLRPGGRTGT
jgi:hypothetical protein